LAHYADAHLVAHQDVFVNWSDVAGRLANEAGGWSEFMGVLGMIGGECGGRGGAHQTTLNKKSERLFSFS